MSQRNTEIKKPDYTVPSMSEVRATKPNGFRVASSFSGCGGSSLGYKMAGFKVVWANEFVPAAQDTYRENHPDTFLNCEDIRKISAEQFFNEAKVQKGELDIFDGSPPCASFSLAGKREEHWGKVKKYSDVQQRTDDLFYEFARLLEEIQPKVFVGENVSGLIKGTAKGYFKEIMARLKSCGYNVKCKVLNAQWLGVPQSRQRTIFIGTRKDLNKPPVHPRPLPYYYSIRDALPHVKRVTGRTGPGFIRVDSEVEHPINTIIAQDSARFEAEVDLSRYALGKEWDRLKVGERSEKYYQFRKPDPERPMDTVQACHGSSPGTATSCVHPFEKRKFRIAEVKRLCSFPDDFILTGNYAQQWERMGRAVPPFMMRAIAEVIYHRILK